MVKVKKIDTPKPKKAELYLEALSSSSKIFKRWYAKKPIIITLLIVFFPVGLFLMWKFADWTKKTKWVITGVIALIITLAYIGAYNSAPTITLNSVKDSKISTDGTVYELTGDVSSIKATTFTINDKPVTLSSDFRFSHTVALKQGENTITLVATNGNGKTNETITIHRTTQAEFAARAEARRLIAEKKAKELKAKKDKLAREKAAAEAEVAKAKAEADAKAAKTKLEADTKAAQEKAVADAKAAAAAKAKAEAQAQHTAYIDGLAATYCSNHQGNRNIYIPQVFSRDVWEKPNKDLLTKYPSQSNCVTIMTFFVDTMPSKYIANIINAKVGTEMNTAEALAAWGWPNNTSNNSSAWGTSGTWTWNVGTCYYGVCPHQQYAIFYNGIVDSTGNY